jgi:exodeoxyribonuclease X
MIGHNVDFDWASHRQSRYQAYLHLSLWLDRFGLNSIATIKVLYSISWIVQNAKDMLKNAHSALADVGICAVILQHICQALFNH